MSLWKSKARSSVNKLVEDLGNTSPDDTLRLGMIFIKLHNAVRVALFGFLTDRFPGKYEKKPDFPILVDEVSSLVNFDNEISRSLKFYNSKRNYEAHELDDDFEDADQKVIVALSEVQGLASLANRVLDILTEDQSESLSLKWSCPKCGQENNFSNKFCSSCRFDYATYENQLKIAEKSRQQKFLQDQISQSRNERGVELCPVCKKHENPINDRYCGSCGADIVFVKVVPSAQKLARASLILSLSPALLFCFFCVINASIYIFFPIVMMLGFISFAVGLLSIFKLIRLRISLSHVSEAFLGMFIGSAELILPAVVLGYLLLNRFSF